MLQNDKNNFRRAKRKKTETVENSPSKVVKKDLQGIAPKNMIMDILNNRGYKSVVPMDEVLQRLDMTIHRFNKILDNKVEMTLTEANAFATWLGVTIEELSPNQPPNVAEKFGLKN